jgi:hypothetical protein
VEGCSGGCCSGLHTVAGEGVGEGEINRVQARRRTEQP